MRIQAGLGTGRGPNKGPTAGQTATLDGLQHEIRGEQASTIGRLHEELCEALAALKGFEERPSTATMTPERRAVRRARLVDRAAYALWNFVVQRECSGFRFSERLLADFAIPAEVRRKMGTVWRRPV